MATQRKPEAKQTEKPVIEKPENFDLEKGLKNVRRLVMKNKTWVKEMANK